MFYHKWFQSVIKYNVLIVLIIFSLVFLSACEKKQKVFKWELQSHATATSIDFRELVKMTENIKTMSNGRFIITPHPGGAITGGPDIFNAVKERRVEMGNGWPNWWSDQHSAWAVMNAGPFDFMNLDASMMYFLAGDGTKLANELSKPEGVIWRAAWWPGMEFGLLSREPIKGIQDLSHKKVRIGPGIPAEALKATTNAVTVSLVADEIRPALEKGELDAVEWTTTAGAWDLDLQSIALYGIVPAIWQPSVLADFLINKQAYDELPADLKAILETAIKSYTLTTTVKAKVIDFEALKAFKNSPVELTQWTKEDIEEWRKVSDKILQQYSEKDEFTKRLIESKKSFKQVYNEYYELFGPYE